MATSPLPTRRSPLEGDQIRNGYINPAFSGTHGRIGHTTPAVSGVPNRRGPNQKGLKNPCLLGGRLFGEGGQKQKKMPTCAQCIDNPPIMKKLDMVSFFAPMMMHVDLLTSWLSKKEKLWLVRNGWGVQVSGVPEGESSDLAVIDVSR